MRAVNRRPGVVLLLSVLIAGGTVVAIALSDRPRALWHAVERFETSWLLTVSLIAAHVHTATALVAVLAYRIINFLIPMVLGLVAYSFIEGVLDEPQ